MKYNFLSLILVLFGTLFTANVSAQTCNERTGENCRETRPYTGPRQTRRRAAMTAVLLERLTIWTRARTGRRIYAEHCRRLRFGCERQIATIVNYIFDVAQRENFDPWLVAAVAWEESRFNPFSESSAGAFGILQILRRSAWSRGLRFIYDRWYRYSCRRELGSCQRPIIQRAVYWLKRTISHCGSTEGGLRMYNSGRCSVSRRYARVVLATHRRFVRRAREIMNRN